MPSQGVWGSAASSPSSHGAGGAPEANWHFLRCNYVTTAPGSRPFTVQSSTYMLFIRVHCKNKVTTVVGTWQVDAGNFNASKMNQ